MLLCVFNQDWKDDHATEEAALRHYLERCEGEEVRAVLADVQELLALDLSESQLALELAGLSYWWVHEPARPFLEFIRDELMAELNKRLK